MSPAAAPTASSPTLQHLRQLVEGMTAGVILVDPAGAILSANPAALTMHGVSRTTDLGATADEYCQRFCLRQRNHHRLERREYPIMRMLAGESFPDMVVEVAQIGENEPRWTHRVHDVVMDVDGGEPDCLALVIQDVSDRYEAEARFEAMFQANPAPAAIVRLADQRYVRVNAGFLELVARARSDVLGRPLRDIDILASAERQTYVAERLTEGLTIPQVEAELPLPKSGTHLVLLAGQPIELADEKCMLFTFADLEPRRKAEGALRDSEQHFATVFRLAPVAMVVTSDENNRIIEVNDAFRQLTGRTSEELLGRVADDIQLWNDAGQRRQVESDISRRGGARNEDVRVLPRTGDPIYCLVSAESVSMEGRQCVVWLYQDITARRNAELELAEAIEAVMKDARWFSRSIMDKLATLRGGDGAPPLKNAPPLSQREREVLELICEDLDDKAIAAALELSSNTVRNHVARLYAKIGVNRRSAAVIWARERGIGGRSAS